MKPAEGLALSLEIPKTAVRNPKESPGWCSLSRNKDPREFPADAARALASWISFQDRIKRCWPGGSDGEREKAKGLGRRGEEGRKGAEGRRMERTEGRDIRERETVRERDRPAGKQMVVAPFIGLFVGSAITSRPSAWCSSLLRRTD